MSARLTPSRTVPVAMATLAPYLLLLGTSFLMFGETTDDPFITFRYAANVAAGRGPVFNAGEHVEGFSSPLHLLLCLAALKVLPAVGILFKLKLASLLFGFVYLFQTGMLARTAGLSRADGILAQTLVALNVNFAIACGNALETTLFGAVLVGAMILFIRESTRGIGWLSSLVLFAAVLCRPEGFAVFALLATVRGWHVVEGKFPKADAIKWTSTFCLLALALTGARLIYYQAPLPNTYYAKNGPLWTSVKLGTESLLQSLSPLRFDRSSFRAGHTTLSQALQLLVAPIFWGLAFVGLRAESGGEGHGAPRAALGAVTLAFCIAAWRSGGDWMFGCRFLAPALAMISVLQCMGLRSIGDWRASRAAAHSQAKARPIPRFAPAQAAAIALWTYAFVLSPWKSWSSSGFATTDEGLLIHSSMALGPAWVQIGQYLKKNVSPGAVIVYSEMGYGPYKNLDKKFIDRLGLTDREIARLPSELKGFFGVSSPGWDRDGDNVLHQVLMRRNFDFVIDFFPPGQAPEKMFGDYGRHYLPPEYGGTSGNRSIVVYSR